jgi:hypothetical protein
MVLVGRALPNSTVAREVADFGTVASIVNPYHIKDFAAEHYHNRSPSRTILGLWVNEP